MTLGNIQGPSLQQQTQPKPAKLVDQEKELEVKALVELGRLTAEKIDSHPDLKDSDFITQAVALGTYIQTSRDRLITPESFEDIKNDVLYIHKQMLHFPQFLALFSKEQIDELNKLGKSLDNPSQYPSLAVYTADIEKYLNKIFDTLGPKIDDGSIDRFSQSTDSETASFCRQLIEINFKDYRRTYTPLLEKRKLLDQMDDVLSSLSQEWEKDPDKFLKEGLPSYVNDNHPLKALLGLSFPPDPHASKNDFEAAAQQIDKKYYNQYIKRPLQMEYPDLEQP